MSDLLDRLKACGVEAPETEENLTIEMGFVSMPEQVISELLGIIERQQATLVHSFWRDRAARTIAEVRASRGRERAEKAEAKLAECEKERRRLDAIICARGFDLSVLPPDAVIEACGVHNQRITEMEAIIERQQDGLKYLTGLVMRGRAARTIAEVRASRAEREMDNLSWDVISARQRAEKAEAELKQAEAARHLAQGAYDRADARWEQEEFEKRKAIDRAEKAEAELAALQEHEEQTHNLLGKILGTDTSLEHAAMRLLDRAEKAEAALAAERKEVKP